MTAARTESSAPDSRTDSDGARRFWRPMTLDYVGHIGDVLKANHKSGFMGETDIFSNHKSSG